MVSCEVKMVLYVQKTLKKNRKFEVRTVEITEPKFTPYYRYIPLVIFCDTLLHASPKKSSKIDNIDNVANW